MGKRIDLSHALTADELAELAKLNENTLLARLFASGDFQFDHKLRAQETTEVSTNIPTVATLLSQFGEAPGAIFNRNFVDPFPQLDITPRLREKH